MNFIRASICYSYLYSPKNWLHRQSVAIKLHFIMLHLSCLPFMSSRQIFIFFIIFLCLYKSIGIYKHLSNYLNKSAIVFAFFLLINIKKYDKLTKYKTTGKIYKFCFFSHLVKQENTIKSDKLCFYLPLSIVRFVSIYLIYLLLIRCFLFTADCEKIVKVAIKECKSVNHFNIKFIFVIIISPQLINIIFEEVDIIKKSYILRNIRTNQLRSLKRAFIIFKQLLQQLLIIYT